MVYLRSIIDGFKNGLLESNGIETAVYFYLTNDPSLTSSTFELSPDQEVSLKGYKRENVPAEQLDVIINRKAIKGIDASSNIFTLAGFYLIDSNKLNGRIKLKYENSNLLQKYFLTRINSTLKEQFLTDLRGSDSIESKILSVICLETNNDDLSEAIIELTKDGIGILELIVLEELEKSLLKVNYLSYDADEVARKIMNEFSNSILKITSNRRKGHSKFEIKDEYDVQDVLYVMLKGIFPNLKDEDPIPKVGGKSTKIDLIIREERILIEVKMIKSSDSNEKHFIEQLKVDFESYHECIWLRKLFCFVYDPYRKTTDIANFRDLDGDRKKNNHEYNVEVILAQ